MVGSSECWVFLLYEMLFKTFSSYALCPPSPADGAAGFVPAVPSSALTHRAALTGGTWLPPSLRSPAQLLPLPWILSPEPSASEN